MPSGSRSRSYGCGRDLSRYRIHPSTDGRFLRASATISGLLTSPSTSALNSRLTSSAWAESNQSSAFRTGRSRKNLSGTRRRGPPVDGFVGRSTVALCARAMRRGSKTAALTRCRLRPTPCRAATPWVYSMKKGLRIVHAMSEMRSGPIPSSRTPSSSKCSRLCTPRAIAEHIASAITRAKPRPLPAPRVLRAA